VAGAAAVEEAVEEVAVEAVEAGEEEAEVGEVAGEEEAAEVAEARQEAAEASGGATLSTGSSSASSRPRVGSPPTCARVRSAPGRRWRSTHCRWRRPGHSSRAGARASTGAA